MGSSHVIPATGVHHINDAILVFVMVLPETAYGHLPAHLPDSHGPPTNFNALHIETIGGGSLDTFLELELVEDGGFAGVVDSGHNDTYLMLPLGAKASHINFIYQTIPISRDALNQ